MDTAPSQARYNRRSHRHPMRTIPAGVRLASRPGTVWTWWGY